MRLVLWLKALIQRFWLKSVKRSAYFTISYELSSTDSLSRVAGSESRVNGVYGKRYAKSGA
jgi:hypothetical protein